MHVVLGVRRIIIIHQELTIVLKETSKRKVLIYAVGILVHKIKCELRFVLYMSLISWTVVLRHFIIRQEKSKVLMFA